MASIWAKKRRRKGQYRLRRGLNRPRRAKREAKGPDGDNDGDGYEDHEIHAKKRPNPPTLIPTLAWKKRGPRQRPPVLTSFA